MRSSHRTVGIADRISDRVREVDRTLLRDVLLVCAADGVVGLSFGAVAVASGTPLWVPVLLSVVVFAGASQFVFVALVTGGSSPLVAALTGVVLNARMVPLGMGVADIVPRTGWRRLVAAHLLTDESAAFTLPRRDPAERRAAFWLTGVLLFVLWNAGVLVGAALGGTVLASVDPGTLGLDAAFPAVLLALLVPALRTRADRRTALTGAVVAVAAVPLLPAGLPAVAAVLGVLAGRARSPRGGAR
ncbi:AzlC family ABC transporter permease [Quadrisphaera setariae]|uniref:AzlC family ABC transporter permease n=1 Tax=Quadrisphaera setariae TaxID=2593304 RepID=UPI001C9C8FB6|nr:AzlC family ABC transporter permease [Quadrisphaera setariae]